MLAELTFEEACRRAAPSLATWTDRVVPAEVAVPATHHYAPAYGWMHAYERQLRRRIEAALGRRLGALERQVFGPSQPLSEGLSNAFVHGHGRDPGRPLEIEVGVGRGGLCFAVRDQGPGFDVAAALDKLDRGRAYYHIAGNGLRSLHERDDAQGWFVDGGRTLVLLFLFAGPALRPVPGDGPASAE